MHHKLSWKHPPEKNSWDTIETVCQIRYGAGGWWDSSSSCCVSTCITETAPAVLMGVLGPGEGQVWSMETLFVGWEVPELQNEMSGYPNHPAAMMFAFQSGQSPDPGRVGLLCSAQQQLSWTVDMKHYPNLKAYISLLLQSLTLHPELSLCSISGPCEVEVDVGKHSASHPSPSFRARWKLALELCPQCWNNTEIGGLALNYLSSALPIIHHAQTLLPCNMLVERGFKGCFQRVFPAAHSGCHGCHLPALARLLLQWGKGNSLPEVHTHGMMALPNGNLGLAARSLWSRWTGKERRGTGMSRAALDRFSALRLAPGLA